MKTASAILFATLFLAGSLSATPVIVQTDTSWNVTATAPAAGWNTDPTFNDATFSPAIVNISTSVLGGEIVESIWNSSKTTGGSVAVWFRKVFTLDAPVIDASLDIYVEADLDFFVNGTLVLSDRNGKTNTFAQVNIAPYLVAGENLFAVNVTANSRGAHMFRSRTEINANSTSGGDPTKASFTAIGLGVSSYPFDQDPPVIRAATPDRTSLVGTLRDFNGTSRAFIRRNGKSMFLPTSSEGYGSTFAEAVSDDGSVIAGSQSGRAVRWVNGGLPQDLGDLPGAVPTTSAVAISGDGSIIVGFAGTTQLFRWTAATGAQPIAFPEGIDSVEIIGLSRDGGTLLADGQKLSATSTDAFALRWTSSEGFHPLDVSSGASNSHVTSVADDGSAVGYWTDANVTQCARWDSAGALTEFPALPDGFGASAPVLSGDGTTIAVAGGFYRSSSSQPATVLYRSGQDPLTIQGMGASAISSDGSILVGGEMIWDAVNGARRIKQILFENYGDFTARNWIIAGWKSFIGQSAGQITVASTGINLANGGREGWIVALPAGVESNPFGGDMLSKSAGFIPAASLSEHYAESVKDMDFYTGFYASWNSKLTVTGSIAGIDPTTISADTAVILLLGEFVFSGKLGDASDYTAGKTKATFALSDGSLIVSWKGSTITYSLQCSFSSTLSAFTKAPENWIAYRDLVGLDSFRDVSRRLVTRFGDFTGHNTVVFSGSNSFKEVDVNDSVNGVSSTRLEGGIDNLRPTVSYIRPANKALSLSSHLKVILKAVGVQEVTVQIDGREPVAATNVIDPVTVDYIPDLWEVTLELVAGENRMEAIATDAAGNVSAPAIRTVLHTPVQGVYVGAFTNGSGDVIGQAKLKLTAAGALSGKLTVAGASYSIKGNLGTNGATTIEILRANLPKLTLELHLTDSSDTNTLVGTLTEEGNPSPWTLDARRILYDAKVNPAPQAGYYTAILPGDASQPETPQGSGFATLRVRNSGAVSVVGKVPDGKAFTASGTLDGDNRLSLYAPIVYAKAKGSIGGVISLTPDSYTSPALCHGAITWHKPAQPGSSLYPAEFTVHSTLDGAPYTPGYTDRTDGSEWPVFNVELDTYGVIVAVLSGGELSASINLPLTLSMPSKIAVGPPNATGLKLTLANATGLITGSFVAPGETKARKIFGIAQQNLAVGAGFFTGTTTTGKVELKGSEVP